MHRERGHIGPQSRNGLLNRRQLEQGPLKPPRRSVRLPLASSRRLEHESDRRRKVVDETSVVNGHVVPGACIDGPRHGVSIKDHEVDPVHRSLWPSPGPLRSGPAEAREGGRYAKPVFEKPLVSTGARVILLLTAPRADRCRRDRSQEGILVEQPAHHIVGVTKLHQ